MGKPTFETSAYSKLLAYSFLHVSHQWCLTLLCEKSCGNKARVPLCAEVCNDSFYHDGISSLHSEWFSKNRNAKSNGRMNNKKKAPSGALLKVNLLGR